MRKKDTDIETLIDSSLNDDTAVDFKDVPELKIEVNLIETDTEFIIEAPLPGIPSENISVNVANDTVTIEAMWPEETSSQKKEKNKPIYTEFMKTNMSRSIILPNTFEKDNQYAELQNGLLTIHVKKREQQKPHSIKIIDEGDE